MTDDKKPVEHSSKPGERYTSEELMVRLKVFIGGCLAVTLIGIVFVVLYSIIFVTQPLGAISPIDSKFFELIIPVATFLCGTLSGIMLAGTGKEAAMAGMQMNSGNRMPSPMPAPTPNIAPQMPSPMAPRPQFMAAPQQAAPSFSPPSFNQPVQPLQAAPGRLGAVQIEPQEDLGLEPGQVPKMLD